MLQVNILGKPVKREPIKVPAEIEEKAKAMLEPENQRNVVVIDKPIDGKRCKT